MEELKTLLNGNVLWVRWQEVGVIAAVYSLLIGAQFMLRKCFAVLAFGKQVTFGRELLFFMSFAVVITLAADRRRVAGVRLAYYSRLQRHAAGRHTGAAADAGLSAGLTGSVMGLWLSYVADLPTGTTMVAVLGLLPLLALALRPVAARLVKARRVSDD